MVRFHKLCIMLPKLEKVETRASSGLKKLETHIKYQNRLLETENYFWHRWSFEQ